MKKSGAIKKYLESYAEKEASSVLSIGYTYHNVLIIPAKNEYATLLSTLDSIKEKNSLVILIVNACVDSQEDTLLNNQKILRKIRTTHFEIWRSKQSQGISLHQMNNCGLLLIDRSSGSLKLPKKSGVGLARKIASDVALQLILQKNVLSDWIHSTDADVILPSDYFSRAKSLPLNIICVTYPYEHNTENENTKQNLAISLYEISLRHYVIGLTRSGSPYAFHTIGSTIAVRAEAYAMVRGFPKKQAGEDFYMLNKLAKIGDIKTLTGPPILIEGRFSDRVPFGTGQSIKKISELFDPKKDYLYYNPKIFSLLQYWLSELSQLTSKSDLVSFEQHIRKHTSSQELIRGLEKLGTFEAIQSIIKACNMSSPTKQLHTWFDGFKTLKLIHYLRDNGYPSINLEKLMQHAPYDSFRKNTSDDRDTLNTLKSHLTNLERTL